MVINKTTYDNWDGIMKFNGNKFVNVQISYAKTKDSIDLAPYIERKQNR